MKGGEQDGGGVTERAGDNWLDEVGGKSIAAVLVSALGGRDREMGAG